MKPGVPRVPRVPRVPGVPESAKGATSTGHAPEPRPGAIRFSCNLDGGSRSAARSYPSLPCNVPNSTSRIHC
jgi:hypothetical protein